MTEQGAGRKSLGSPKTGNLGNGASVIPWSDPYNPTRNPLFLFTAGFIWISLLYPFNVSLLLPCGGASGAVGAVALRTERFYM